MDKRLKEKVKYSFINADSETLRSSTERRVNDFLKKIIWYNENIVVLQKAKVALIIITLIQEFAIENKSPEKTKYLRDLYNEKIKELMSIMEETKNSDYYKKEIIQIEEREFDIADFFMDMIKQKQLSFSKKKFADKSDDEIESLKEAFDINVEDYKEEIKYQILKRFMQNRRNSLKLDEENNFIQSINRGLTNRTMAELERILLMAKKGNMIEISYFLTTGILPMNHISIPLEKRSDNDDGITDSIIEFLMDNSIYDYSTPEKDPIQEL